MKLNISFREPFALKVSKAPARVSASVESAPDRRPFRSELEDFAETSRMGLLKNQQVRRVPPPEKFQKKLARPGLLSVILSKLRSQGHGARKLSLVETVSLGEKRFVAIVNADGCSYLVGGGTAGVSMLAQLDKKQSSDEGIHSVLHGLTERAV